MRGGAQAALAFAVALAPACSRSPRSPGPAPFASVSPPPEIPQASSAAPEAPPRPPAVAPEPRAPLCGSAGRAWVFVSPEHPMRGQWMNVVAVSENAVDARLVV